MLSYDLSDISFEEWKDIALVSSDKYPADFYKTKANLDFEILDIPITGKEIYNFKGCNVKDIESLESYSIFFDINMDDLKEMIESPENFDIKASDMCGHYIIEIDDIKDNIVKLYKLLDKLQDLLYKKDL